MAAPSVGRFRAAFTTLEPESSVERFWNQEEVIHKDFFETKRMRLKTCSKNVGQ